MTDLDKFSWIQKSSMSIARSHPAVAAYREKIYIFGGGGSDFSSLASTAIYDTREDTWISGRDMPGPRSGAAALTAGNKIYVIGGGIKLEDGAFRFLRRVEIYHPEQDTWETGPDMLMPHDYPAAALLDNCIYIIGGHHPDAVKGGPKTDPGFNFCERLDLSHGSSWQEIAPLPTPRFALSAVVSMERILAMGGVAFTKEGFNNFNIIEIYYPAEGIWRKEKDTSLPWPAAGFNACAPGGRIFIFGGYSGDAIHNRAAYYLEKGGWQEITPMPVSRAAMGIGAAENRLYIVGGWAEDGRTPTDTVYSTQVNS